MRKPNYDFEKRQKDLAKRKKQEEKRQRKLGRPEGETDETAAENPDAPETPTE